MSDTNDKDGMTIEDLAAMMQREFVAKEERDAARFEKIQATLDEHSNILNEHTETLAEHTTILNEHTETLEDHGSQLTSLNTILIAEVSERDRMQTVLENQAGQISGLSSKAA